MIDERYQLVTGRIREIPREESVPEPFREYFRKTAGFIGLTAQVLEKMLNGWAEIAAKKELKDWNDRLYEDILPANYGTSYGNPAYAVSVLGEEYGQLLSFLYTEIRGLIVYAYEKRKWDFTVAAELFAEIYNMFQDEIPKAETLRETLYWYVSDYSDEMAAYRVRESLDPSLSFARDIIMEEDLRDDRYLYLFGEYISDNICQVSAFLNTLSQEEIDAMASTYTEGYRIGFLTTGKDIKKKKTVNIRFQLGFERMIRAAVLQFEKMGLQPVIYRAASHAVNKRQHLRIGYYGAVPNKQYDYDHRGDAALYLDQEFVQRKLRVMQVAYEKMKELAAVHGGPAVVEVFGEEPFVPMPCPQAMQLSKAQQKLQVTYDSEAGQITNRYIKGEERSFTIIAYPVPEIGEDFPDIFRETVKINTLDYKLYQQIQQRIIDALDTGDRVHIKGLGDNQTDLIIALHPLADPERQTNFENCVADVNIPVGEVFTSPLLKGTQGILHVSRIYLNELCYRDLKITFQDGRITDYTCKNFDTEEENKKYIFENVLFHHDTLPMGEFAIGTNTAAYVMARKYGIEGKLPILIAEKMGPHFAVGDTCYSWAEDTPVYNPDGKEIVARDNEVSILRREDIAKAYLGCHTDITIPYDELESVAVITSEGEETAVIRDGRFVLPGTEELNRPFEGGIHIDKNYKS
ncbi:leucyl aminopeptidase [Lactonifactor sp. BIOML-A3]|nr:leucyl aminopeptidase [Lactonifactor sp. BIOML-A5]MSA08191.1 leucyl aminopeptidase [Lactonifactor sp. BIOML-A4]MSA11807.1 leucyl aminopeptidase [Lactonifactor sp. BIOML-A3]MSA15302.1 leucyl aminopeptidase [Lactonifactor sp. BIOML-A2]MSA35908.1 leucyl aminopeptidase [Lactonifactor sp. BIOML-A1]MSB12045.1 leucyl aminopeptidase [Lactonifactor sp. BIOML-A6]MSB68922.1 leucyl aminopeptidase [Lactonifactor sp. BIOML-A7]